MTGSDIPEGYPDSPAADLDPGGPVLGLDDADLEASEEGLVTPAGEAPPDDTGREDRFSEAPDPDQLAAQQMGNAGSRAEDAANFADNAAEWSRERS